MRLTGYSQLFATLWAFLRLLERGAAHAGERARLERRVYGQARFPQGLPHRGWLAHQRHWQTVRRVASKEHNVQTFS